MGVNEFVEDGREDHDIEVLKIDAASRARAARGARRSCAATRSDAQGATRALDAHPRRARAASANLMPAFMRGAPTPTRTLGEIVDVLREEFGEYREPAVF